MNRLLASLALGAVAGIVDVLPMIVAGTSVAAMVSAFLHWVVLGFIIVHVDLRTASWLKGSIIGLASAVPVGAMLVETEPRSVPLVMVMSALLGAGVGWVAGRAPVLRGRTALPRAPRPD